MAESGGSMSDSGSGGGSWWEGWLQSAKEKSAAAFDMVRKDLAEFGCTMQKDTGHAVEVTSSTLKDSLKAENTSAAKEKVTKGLNAFLEGVSRALTVPPDDDDQIPITSHTAEEMFDRAKARLHTVQVDPGTYINEPSGSPEAYKRWCEEDFNMEEVKGEISELLVSKVEVRGLYTKLVPSQVSHLEFWRRYFYKLHQIKLDQARKEALMKRAEKSRTDDSLSWEDDWSGDEEDDGSDWERLPRPGQHASASRPAQEQDQSTKPEKSGTVPSSAPPSSQDASNTGSSPVSPGKAESGSVAQPVSLESVPVQAGSLPAVEERLTAPVEESDPRVMTTSSPSTAEKVQAAQKSEPAAAAKSPPVADRSVFPSETVPSQIAVKVALPSDTVSAPSSAVEGTGAAGTAEGEIIVKDTSAMDFGTEASGATEAAAEPPVMESPAVSVGPASTSLPAPTEPVPIPDTQQAGGTGVVAPPVQKTLAVDVPGQEEEHYLKTVDKGDIVVVGSDHGSPLSAASDPKDVDEDWEQDLDVELTEEDMKAAEELAKKLGDNLDLEDDWESWE